MWSGKMKRPVYLNAFEHCWKNLGSCKYTSQQKIRVIFCCFNEELLRIISLKALNVAVAQRHPSVVQYKRLANSFLRTEHLWKEKKQSLSLLLSLPLSLITSLLHHSPSHVLLMYLWNYWNVNVPLLPLIFKTKGYRCAGCTHTDTGPTGNGKRSFNLILCHAPKSSSSLCIFLNLFGSSFAYLSALFRSKIPAFIMARRSAARRGGQQLMGGCFRSTAHIVPSTTDCISETNPWQEVLYFCDRRAGTEEWIARIEIKSFSSRAD